MDKKKRFSYFFHNKFLPNKVPIFFVPIRLVNRDSIPEKFQFEFPKSGEGPLGWGL